MIDYVAKNMKVLCLAAVILFVSMAVYAGASEAGVFDSGGTVSTRTEKVSGSHVVTTVVVPVSFGEETYYCVISEDRISGNSSDKTIALAQSCDFSTSR